ncbi:uncharacterized protein LOC106636395 [Copidosoma floridanum]|uniref:uncharacterized protein LOC106636395 n=1 Tax=Copidosoma floridanum TaxID=29053 RepID=UPI0006C977A3|nr:uncharacterized protein LOC106636395 [Copidosoma floridanum]
MTKNYRDNSWEKAEVVERLGPVSYQVKTAGGNVGKRHVDQLKSCNREEKMSVSANKEASKSGDTINPTCKPAHVGQAETPLVSKNCDKNDSAELNVESNVISRSTRIRQVPEKLNL